MMQKEEIVKRCNEIKEAVNSFDNAIVERSDEIYDDIQATLDFAEENNEIANQRLGEIELHFAELKLLIANYSWM